MAENTADSLSPKQEEALLALLHEPTVGKAAQRAGVGERTLYRWLDEPAFSFAYRRARRESFAQAIALTQRYAPHAVQTLARAMTDSTCPHSARIAAANSLLKFSRDSIELDDLAARVDALERAASEDPAGGDRP